MPNGLSIAMLSWKAHATARHTLESWRRADLFARGDECFIYFNQRTPQDDALAAEFGVDAKGTEVNLGIWGGMDAIEQNAKGDYILFLQNDHVAVATAEETRHWIDAGLELLRTDRADIVMLWNRFERVPGWGTSHFFDYHYVQELEPRAQANVRFLPHDWNRDTLYRKLHRLFRPSAALRHVNGGIPYLERHPEKILPKYVRREGDFYILDSRIQTFSESPLLVSRRFYNRISTWGKAHPCHRTILGYQELEPILNCRWWRRQHFRMAVCDGGVFAHRRVDDSWRTDHQSYNQQAVSSGWKK